jgi:hypothetical protein
LVKRLGEFCVVALKVGKEALEGDERQRKRDRASLTNTRIWLHPRIGRSML